MSGWLSRLFGRGDDNTAVATRPAPAPRPEPPPSSREPAAPADPARQMARRPLIDRDGRLAGFEFPLPEVLLRRLEQGAPETVLLAHLGALAAATRSTVEAGRVALIAVPREVAAQQFGQPALRERWQGLWLAFDAKAFGEDGRSGLQVLRAFGAHLGAQQSPQRGAKFVRIDAGGLDRDAVCAAVEACRKAAPEQGIVVTGLADVDDVEAALEAGAALAAGHFERQSARAKASTLPPTISTVTRLLNQVLHGADLPVLSAELRADVSLSYELLRHANSPLLGMTRKVDAIDQAVMLLGRDAIYRWLCTRLLAALPGRTTARALQEIALARALLFERLAPACDASPTTGYTIGMLSLLDVMVPMPMAEAIQPLNLPPASSDALLHRAGPLGAMLTLASSLERGDLAAAAAVAPAFGGLPAALQAQEAAWQAARECAAELWPRA